MARRPSTIGHDPLKAMIPAAPPAAAAPPPPPPRAARKPTEKKAATKSAAPEPPPPPPPAQSDAKPEAPPSREAEAMGIVQTYYGWSAAAGLLPLPWIDVAAIIGLQVKMLESLARLYKVPFDAGMIRPIVVALISGGGSHLLVAPAVSTLKAIPVVGHAVAMLTMPAIAAASCWATGRVFVMHFESGGTLLDFDPAKARQHYAQELKAKG